MEIISSDGDEATIIRVKAVPGARRDQIVGPLGDRLKIRVAAPPEGGKANLAICSLLARALGARERDVEVVSGPASAEKTIRIRGVSSEQALAALLPSSDQ